MVKKYKDLSETAQDMLFGEQASLIEQLEREGKLPPPIVHYTKQIIPKEYTKHFLLHVIVCLIFIIMTVFIFYLKTSPYYRFITMIVFAIFLLKLLSYLKNYFSLYFRNRHMNNNMPRLEKQAKEKREEWFKKHGRKITLRHVKNYVGFGGAEEWFENEDPNYLEKQIKLALGSKKANK